MSRRVVLQHTRGRWNGIWQILGTTDAPNERLGTTLTGLTFPDKREGIAAVVHLSKTGVYYRELPPKEQVA